MTNYKSIFHQYLKEIEGNLQTTAARGGGASAQLKRATNLVSFAPDLVDTCAKAHQLVRLMLNANPFDGFPNFNVGFDYGKPKFPLEMQVQDSMVQVNFPYDSFLARLKLGGNASNDNQKLTAATKVFSTLIPNFQMPTQWKANEKGEKHLAFSAKGKLENTLTMEEFTKLGIKSAVEHNVPVVSEGGHFILSSDYQDNYKHLVGIKIKILQNTVPLDVDLDISKSDREAGKLLGTQTEIVMPVSVSAQLRIPTDLAYYLTYATDSSDFLPYSLAEHLASLWYFGTPDLDKKSKKVKPAPRHSTPIHINKMINDTKKDKSKDNARPRVNQDGFTVLRDTTPFYIPQDFNKLDSIISLYKNAYDSENGTVYKLAIRKESNMPIAVDWVNQKYIYTTKSNSLGTINLEGSSPLDEITIWRHFRELNVETIVDFIDSIATSAVAKNLEKDFSDSLTGYVKEYGLGEDVAAGISSLRYQINTVMKAEDLRFGHLTGALPTPEFTESRMGARFPIISQAFINVCKAAWDNFDNLTSPVPIKYGIIRFILTMVVKYSDPVFVDKIKKDYALAMNRNKPEPIDINQIPESISLPNVPGLESMMPHQAEIHQRLRRGEEAGIISIDPGGGKTITIISDIIALLQEGKIKRPLVVAPPTIIGEWAKEINFTSQGKINCFTLETYIYRKLSIRVGLRNQDIVEMMKKLPINSIVLTSLSFLRSGTETSLYLGNTATRYYNAEMFRDVGFDYIAIDESHRIKNLDAGQTQAVYIAAQSAKYYRLVSGTIISDKPSDYVGQMGLITYAAFGDADTFQKDYRQDKKSWKQGAAPDSSRIVQAYASKSTVKSREWSFMLPKIQEAFWPVEMTSNQQRFYKSLLDEILEEIKKSIETQRKLKRAEQLEQKRKKLKEGEEDVDLGIDEEDNEAAIEKALKKHFFNLEIFMNAPDSNEAFINQTDARVTEQDLVSPKVAMVDRLIDDHFKIRESAGGTRDDNKEKIIVFGYNRAVSRHIIKHSKHKNIMIHYIAGDTNAVQKFRVNPRYQVLVGDETGLKEGLNLQVASRMIRLQTLWSPGNQEQALARMFRPDPKLKDKKDRRKLVYFDWLVFNRSIEIAKTARLISKILIKAEFDEYGNEDFSVRVKQKVEELPMISMKLETIEEYTVYEDLQGKTNKGDFFGAYETYTGWKDDTFKENIKALQEKLALKHGKEIDPDEVQDLAMVPVESNTELPNSKGTYVPWIKNVKPTDFPQLGLRPLIHTEEDDEEGENISNEDRENVVLDDLVFTEFGPGYIDKIFTKMLEIKIPGFKSIQIPGWNVYQATEEKEFKKFKKEFERLGEKGMPKLDIKSARGSNFQVQDDNESEKTTKTKPKDVVSPDKPNAIFMHVAIVNGLLTLFTKSEDQDVSKIMPRLGYSLVEEFYYQQPKNPRAFTKYLDTLQELHHNKKIIVREDLMDSLGEIEEIYKTNKENIGNVRSKNFPKSVKTFFTVDHKLPKDKKEIRPYSIVFNGALYITYNKETTKLSLVKKYLNQINGVSKISEEAVFAERYVLFLKKKSEIKAELKNIKKNGIEIQNMVQFKKELEQVVKK